MPGIFVTKGMTLRIPKGALRIRVSGGDPGIEDVRFEVALDVWEHWLEIGRERLEAAESARKRLESAKSEEDHRAKAEALGSELQAGMVATSAAAFAIDSFYASVKARLPVDPALVDSWRKNRTGRPAQIAETFKRGFNISHDGFSQLREGVEQIFRFRDWAVHAPAEFKEPVLHPVLEAGVEWRFIAFGVENCREISQFAEDAITQLMERPKTEHSTLCEWCEAYVGRTEAI